MRASFAVKFKYQLYYTVKKKYKSQKTLLKRMSGSNLTDLFWLSLYYGFSQQIPEIVYFSSKSDR
jgi:hypothetical protein